MEPEALGCASEQKGLRRHGTLQARSSPTLPGHHTMGTAKIFGILLIVAGALGLVYGGFTYTKETHSAKLGPITLQVKDKETVYIPVILSAAALGLGAFLLVAGRKSS